MTSPVLVSPSFETHSGKHGSIISELLDTFEAHVPNDIASTCGPDYDALYSYATERESPIVMLDPVWTLPRRNSPTADETAHVNGQQSQAMTIDTENSRQATPLDNASTSPAAARGSGTQSPESLYNHRSPLQHNRSTPQLYPHFDNMALTVPSAFSGPSSAPAETFNFDFSAESMCGPAPRQRYVSRASPYQSPEQQISFGLDAGYYDFDSEGLMGGNDPSGMMGRRRSVSMSACPLPQRPPIGRADTLPPDNYIYTSPSHHSMFSGSSETLYAPAAPRASPMIARERKAVATKRRATLQQVVRDAKLPSPVLPSRPGQVMSHGGVTYEEASRAMDTVLGYIKQVVNKTQGAAQDFSYISESHYHLIKDLKCRLKARAVTNMAY